MTTKKPIVASSTETVDIEALREQIGPVTKPQARAPAVPR